MEKCVFAALYEERALLLGRLKKHQQALAIYTQILKNYKAAEKYCIDCYDPKDPQHSQVITVLFENSFSRSNLKAEAICISVMFLRNI